MKRVSHIAPPFRGAASWPRGETKLGAAEGRHQGTATVAWMVDSCHVVGTAVVEQPRSFSWPVLVDQTQLTVNGHE